MENAWLDSLTEDWVSEPRSAGSPSENLPHLRIGTPASGSCNSHGTSSRIPIIQPRKYPDPQNSDLNSLPLGERNLNHNNIGSARRDFSRPSKLHSDISKSNRGRQVSRTMSVSTTSSVQRPTVNHKSLSVSPKKQGGQQETPEWKRRLLHGDVAYGEQRDLFSSVGLENIFRPPLKQVPPSTEYARCSQVEEITMPSSPPPYPPRDATGTTSPMKPNMQENERAIKKEGPRNINYRAVDDCNVFLGCDSSQNSGFPAAPPSSTPAHVKAEASRVTSGQSDVRHEDLSPIFVSRQSTIDGHVDFAAVEGSSIDLDERLQNLGIQNDHDSSQVAEAAYSGNATMNEEDFTQIGNYVNLGRGGISEEGSFQRRMLSPSSLPPVDESAMLREESIQASTPKDMAPGKKQATSNNMEIPRSGVTPRESLHTLNQRHMEGIDTTTKPGSGSPLKLFGSYDTFTNEKLLRRLSQFEENLREDSGEANDPKKSDQRESGDESTGPAERRQPQISGSSPLQCTNLSELAFRALSLEKVTKFGHGKLDGFEFTEESLDSAHAISDFVPDNGLQQKPDAGKAINFTLQPSPVLESGMTTRRQSRHLSMMSKERVGTKKFSSHHNSSGLEASSPSQTSHQPQSPGTPRKFHSNGEGKRLLHSPPKNPTSKRRRTLHESDIEHRGVEVEAVDIVRESHEQAQSISGKKRKDARHGELQEPANPEVMAMRQVLRPRTSTLGQRSIQGPNSVPTESNQSTSSHYSRLEQKEKIAKVQAELDATVPFRGPPAVATGQAMLNNSRKGSVTTQDFLDEAKKIMAGIRGKARPSSGLASVEESRSDDGRIASPDPEPNQEDSYDESTREPFSRPPSREGGPLSRPPQKQQDPDLLDHLRKYEEVSDLDGVIMSSLKSIQQAKDAIEALNGIERHTDETVDKSSGGAISDGFFESDIPNIKITEYPEIQGRRKHSTPLTTLEAEFSSHSSNASSDGLTGRSIPTGSSRGSDSRRVIEPHTVSHLIPEQLAGMIFDRERRIWMKRKTVATDVRGAIHPAEDSDDDPLGEIPDLTIDETQELRRVEAGRLKRREKTLLSEVQRHRLYQQIVEQSDEVVVLGELTSARSQTDRSHGVPISSKNVTEEFGHPVTADGSKEEPFEDVEQEISIHESRVTYETAPLRRRNITISFSSPLASIIPPDEFCESVESEGAEDMDNNLLARHQARRMSHSSQGRSQSAAHRKTSLGRCAFVSRPVSRIDEREEESFIEQVHDSPLRRSISIVISTPRPKRSEPGSLSIVPSSSEGIYDGLLQLTPLSDFTMNRPDESFALEASRIEYRPDRGTAPKKRSLSLSVKELVQRITDVEPYEPFWEHIKELQLQEKRLQNLHMLSKFCGRLVLLDVSNNDIGQLDGAPSTIRHLRIARNHLSDLSSWDHLINLQFVDVSNNQLTSLEGLSNLVHLRGLRADKNKIRSVNGIAQLDGLISLRLRDNELQSIDFTGSSLHRLTELDLKGNSIRQVHGLNELQSLTTLNLEDNVLDSFNTRKGNTLWALKYLKLGGNNLRELDVAQYPNMRLLYLDRNRLGKVTGLSKTKHLDSLSLRQQQDGFSIDTLFLNEALEVRKLFLSGNVLGNFDVSVDFLNLQYLELANCGLERLPTKFGQLLSNLRILNLNCNALKEIKPLLGIVRLKKLHLAGNRLFRLRQTTNVLSQFSSLAKVDLRNNPFTLGFYPPILEKRLIVRDETDNGLENLLIDPFALPDADKAKDTVYMSCLDMETKMRRRVFEMLMLSGCVRLKWLDGLMTRRVGLEWRDKVWHHLVEAGIVCSGISEAHDDEIMLQESKAPQVINREDTEMVHKNGEVEFASKVSITECWPAEDSFA